MFLSVVARPRYDDQNIETWDGKIGIYPFTLKEPAKRKSPNRPRGTLITKAMTSVTRDAIWRFIIDKVLVDIKAKCPLGTA